MYCEVDASSHVDDLLLDPRAELVVRHAGERSGLWLGVHAEGRLVASEMLGPRRPGVILLPEGTYEVHVHLPILDAEPREIVRTVELVVGETTAIEVSDEDVQASRRRPLAVDISGFN